MAAQPGDRTTPAHTLWDENGQEVPTVEQNDQQEPADGDGDDNVEVEMTVRRKSRKSKSKRRSSSSTPSGKR